MANKDRPAGFKPYGDVKQIAIMESGSALYAGEFVRLASDGQIDVVAAGESIVGLALDTATAAGAKIRVSVYPTQLYVGQADSTHLTNQSIVGNVCDLLCTAHDTAYKASRMELDSSEANTTSGQMLLIGLDSSVDNAFGANARFVCQINEHQFDEDFAGI